MLIGYLLIWCLLFVVLKYDLKQNTINSILRATCLTLITYIVLQINVKENFSRRYKNASSEDASTTKTSNTDDSNTDTSSSGPIGCPTTTTIQENPITVKAKSYKKKKKMCKYIQEQQRLTVNSLYQNFKELENTTSINDKQIDVLQNNFNDLITVNQYTDTCNS